MYSDLDQLLGEAVRASLEAGRAILDVYGSGFDVERKADNSPLTIADKRSHEVISSALKSSLIPVLSEEGAEIRYEERREWKRLWIVDPLDGTKEFIKRNGEFTVNIALVQNGKPLMGVIYSPVKQVLYYASQERGAYKLAGVSEQVPGSVEDLVRDSRKLPVSTARTKYTVVASRSHMNDETTRFIQRLKEKHKDVEIVSAGSSLKICLVAEGVADIYPRFGPTMEWDTAAGQAIAECAGKNVTDASTGKPVVYNRKDLRNHSFIVQ